MSFKPTEEQERIFHFIEKRNENILIKAYAGTGKTTTIVEAIKLLPKDKNIIFLAFNKHIQEELTKKLPEYVRCYTTYGLGTSAIKRKYGDKIEFDEFKIDKIIKEFSKKWRLNEEFENDEEIYLYLQSLKKLVNICRLTLTLKPDFIPNIAEKYEIDIHKPNDFKRVIKLLDTATVDRKTFDFIDMVYLPAIDNSIWMFPQDYVFVDEVQDLNKCQIRIIEKILKKDKKTGNYIGRLISVGDAFQSIYGFNGTDEKSFQWFEKFNNTKVLPLSISFRCSKNVIKKAQEIVPDIKALPNAPDGIVREGNVLEEAGDGDFILCRTTTPIVKLFFEFLVKQKKVMIKGSDIGIQLIELIGTINNIPKLIDFWEKEIDKYKKELEDSGVININEHSGFVNLQDKVNTLLFLAKISNSVEDLKNKIRMIFKDDIEGIVLSTVHKVKGLEANRVFIIRPDLLPMKNVNYLQYVQEKNLEYVAYTRAKNELIFDYNWTDEE